jgi:hypothetical protein
MCNEETSVQAQALAVVQGLVEESILPVMGVEEFEEIVNKVEGFLCQ